MVVSAVLIALRGFTKLNITALLILLVLLMLAPVFSAFRVWLDMLGSAGASTSQGGH